MRKAFMFLSFLSCMITGMAQVVSIGTNSPDPSAILDVSSTSKGFLPPRMTAAQRDSIVAPAAGLIIWCTNCSVSGELQVFNGTTWTNLIGGIASVPLSEAFVVIGSQRWMLRNLDVTTYRNGDPIPEVKDPAVWDTLKTGAWCYYNDDSTQNTTYGKLYNWYAVNDSRGLAPKGWHIPSDIELATLSNTLGGDLVAGGKMKDTSMLWMAPNKDATNSSGFTALPGGFRDREGVFQNIRTHAYFWSATESSSPAGPNTAWGRTLYLSSGKFNVSSAWFKVQGFSVRCLKN